MIIMTEGKLSVISRCFSVSCKAVEAGDGLWFLG
ncbi:MAG: hypothetical protein CDV28_13430 [Candidatus Electronema aureum]|uniref:Uncharacterized protein n=1 Tax=Candidatus Electronema aureum TaxID=2005002 RepID=A0A521FZQ1_9BACT|nr:MAG: hypothetical protein CDV28_13430 [Candidatus Electronema aureum]